ncbi:MAG: cupin-like domain-containing protein [Acidobacteria bacterium]|nr:cupin-like domain-containing protein [Acidobacteriota bacterium]MCB9396806.1 cupin-like domain-containing protein [Acidobacteriota bacterium]
MAISTAWNLWLIENYLAGVAPDRCRALWQAAGLADFELHWTQLALDPWVQGAHTHWSRLRKRQSVLASLAQLRGPIRLTRLRKTPSSARLSDFIRTQSPVIFPTRFQQMDWFQALFATKKSQVVQCYQYPQDMECVCHSFLAELHQGNQYSIRAHNQLLAQSGFTDLIPHLPASPFKEFQKPTLWLQPSSDFTGFHFDRANHLWTVLEGSKKIWMVAPYETEMLYPERHFSPIDPRQPNRSKFPKYQAERVVVATIKPDQWLLVPSGVWHAVETIQPSMMLTYAKECP